MICTKTFGCVYTVNKTVRLARFALGGIAMKECCNKRRRVAGNFCFYAIAFGAGLILSCFCPYGLLMFIAAVVIVALGIALARCKK